MDPSKLVHTLFQIKNTLKELTPKEKTHFGNLLTIQTSDRDLLVGFLNIHSLPSSRKGDLSYLIIDKKYGHIGLNNTGRHWTTPPEDYRTPQIFRGHFMSQQLDSTTAYNIHNSLSGYYQNGGTTSLSTGNIIGRRLESGRDILGLGKCTYQQFRGRWEGYISIITSCRPVPPTAGVCPGSVYDVYAQ